MCIEMKMLIIRSPTCQKSKHEMTKRKRDLCKTNMVKEKYSLLSLGSCETNKKPNKNKELQENRILFFFFFTSS